MGKARGFFVAHGCAYSSPFARRATSERCGGFRGPVGSVNVRICGNSETGHAFRYLKAMASQKQKILTASVLAAALGAGLYYQLRTPVVPRPKSVEAVMPMDMAKALADAGSKPAAPRGGRTVPAGVKVAAGAEISFERTGRNSLQIQKSNATLFALPLEAALVGALNKA